MTGAPCAPVGTATARPGRTGRGPRPDAARPRGEAYAPAVHPAPGAVPTAADATRPPAGRDPGARTAPPGWDAAKPRTARPVPKSPQSHRNEERPS